MQEKRSLFWIELIKQPHRVVANSGSPVVKKFTPFYDKNGVLQLEASGEHNLYAEIQSHAASTDLAMIINRYFNGDPNALARVQGAYVDISQMPTNIHEAMTLMSNAKHDFDTLPVDIKEKFGNDVNQFLAQLGTEKWFEAMQVKKEESEVKPVEQE